jgi:protoporphyrinogen/coproporphyrinogen III oxidase
MTRVAVVGGGIAGLAAAHALRAQAPDTDIVVLEGRDRVGGHVRTDTVDGYVCESGPDGFLDNAPHTLALVDSLGIASSVLASRDEARRRYIFRGGRLHEVPMSPGAFVTSGLLSIGSKLRVFAEPFAARAPRHDESILHFAERHIGREAAHVLVGSMVSGIFAGDPSQLSLRACFPKMHEMDATYGSLVRAMLATRRERRNENGMGAPAGRLTSFAGGMEELVRALARSLGPDVVRTGSRVSDLRIRHSAAVPGPRLVGARAFSLSSNGQRVEADAVVLAGPAHETAELVRAFAPAAATMMSAIQTAPIAVVCLGYDDAALTANRGALDGFGFLVPRGEQVRILGALWETSIYANRAPAGKALLRVMIGGATDPGVVDLSDAGLLAVVRDDLQRTMGLTIAPEFVRIVRHARGIPQYTAGHLARLERMEAALAPFPGLFVAGNSYRGVAMNACIEDGVRLAPRIAEYLRSVRRNGDYAVAR